MDIELWRSIMDNDFAVPAGCSVSAITAELLNHLGSLDADLREGPVYLILESWIQRGCYDRAALTKMATMLLHNLAIGLGQRESDTVFLRSFSMLILANIIDYDLTHPALPENEMRQVLEHGLAYIHAENDLRGHDDEKGWAHTSAHAGDLLWALAQHRLVSAQDLERMMNAIAEKITAPIAFVYLYDEDERLTRAVMAALQRDLLTLPYLAEWLERFTNPKGRIGWDETFENGRLMEVAHSKVETCARHNSKHFLRSLYFQLRTPGFASMPLIGQRPPIADELLPLVDKALSRIRAWN